MGKSEGKIRCAPLSTLHFTPNAEQEPGTVSHGYAVPIYLGAWA